jgi:hypothetical protein
MGGAEINPEWEKKTVWLSPITTIRYCYTHRDRLFHYHSWLLQHYECAKTVVAAKTTSRPMNLATDHYLPVKLHPKIATQQRRHIP